MYYLRTKPSLTALDNPFPSFGLARHAASHGEEGVGRLLRDNTNNGPERNYWLMEIFSHHWFQQILCKQTGVLDVEELKVYSPLP